MRTTTEVLAKVGSVDCRPAMVAYAEQIGTDPYLLSFRRHDEAKCSTPICDEPGIWVTLHENGRCYVGYLFTRCEEHQVAWEQKWAVAA